MLAWVVQILRFGDLPCPSGFRHRQLLAQVRLVLDWKQNDFYYYLRKANRRRSLLRVTLVQPIPRTFYFVVRCMHAMCPYPL